MLNDINELRKNGASLQELIDALKSNKNIFRSVPASNYLTALYEYTLNSQRNLPNFNIDMRPLYILHVCVWGEGYINKMINYLLPSLMAPNNLPKVSANYNICLWIHCDSNAHEKLKKSLIINKLSEIGSVKFDVIPASIFQLMKKANNFWLAEIFFKLLKFTPSWKYSILGCLQDIAMQGAQKQKAFISFLMPDILFSESAISNLLSGLGDSKIIGLATTFRSDSAKIKDPISKYYIDDYLKISGRELSNIIVNSMHEAAKVRIVSTQNKRFQATAQLIFSYKSSIVMRALHYHPVVVNFANVKKIVPSTYEPIDESLINNILDEDGFQDNVLLNTSSDFYCFMEISDNDAEHVINRNVSPDVRGILEEFINSYRWKNVNRFLLSARYTFNIDGENTQLLSDIDDAELLG